MRIQHNIMAMSAYRNYTNNVAAMKKNLEKLSSGYKINRAGDDAAGLAISEKMRAQITGLQTAQKNAKDGISLVQTAEGALTEVHDMLNRMVELATQSANGTYDNTTDRNQMQKEVDQLREEINRIADSSNFNGINLLDGSMSTAASKIGSVSMISSGTAPTPNWVEASGVVTWTAESKAITSATIGNAPSTSVMHLHSEGQSGSIGEFKIDLGGMKVIAGSATATIKLTIGSATYTYKASAGKTVTATMVATDLATKTVYVTASGTLTIATKAAASVSVPKGAIVYEATAGTGTKANSVTFTAKTLVLKATTAANLSGSKATTLSASTTNLIPTGMNVKHNYTVKASVSGNVKDSDGFNQVGVTESTNMKADDKRLFGQAVLKFDVTKLKDGMKMTVGTKSFTIALTEQTAKKAGASQVIDLHNLVAAGATTVSIAASKQGLAAQAIANKFNQADNRGIEIGVNGDNNLIVAEKVKANGQSAATEDVQNAMKDYKSFKELVSFQENNATDGEDGEVKLEINTSKLYNGNKVVITDADGKETTYTISTDKMDQGKTGYVYVADIKKDTASALAAAIGNGATVEGKNVIVKFAVEGGTTDANKTGISAKMTGNKGLMLQIGDTADSFNQLSVTINDCHTDSLGIADISIADQESAAKAIDAIKDAINYVSDVRGTLGATQNRLDHTINNLGVMTENIQDAESTIRDVDVAEEMMAYTKNNILIQSAQAMLAQANQVPQGVLQLLG